MTSPRLIERWLPIAALGEESGREGSAAQKPPVNRLHVWWARRPLIASRAAILASLLPSDTDRDAFMRAIGIHGDPVDGRRQVDQARRTGIRVDDPYGYKRAFTHSLSVSERSWFAAEAGRAGLSNPVVLDPTAGGGSIPFESVRLGLRTFANDLNPVASLIERATVEWPQQHGIAVHRDFVKLTRAWTARVADKLGVAFPQNGLPDRIDTTYLWARTITCVYCDGLIPLSPNWRLAPDGTGVRLTAHMQAGPGASDRRCTFEVVQSASQHALGTVSDGDVTCPFPDCGRVIDSESVKEKAQAGGMGEQLFAVVYKRRIVSPGKIGKAGKVGKAREKWERGYRAPDDRDIAGADVQSHLSREMPRWEALDLVPNELFPPICNDDRPIRYGMPRWRDHFSPRQLFVQCTAVEAYCDLLREAESSARLTDVQRASFGYLALALDKMRDYNSRMTRWHSGRELIVNTFDRHDFAFKWSYAEMAPMIDGLGYDWAFNSTAKCIEELIVLSRPDVVMGKSQHHVTDLGLFGGAGFVPPPVTMSCRSADSLSHITDESVDVVVMDPPYYDNLMYAELSDFFYVWLKRTAGHVFPELFTRGLTDKQNEAVASPAKFQGEPNARRLAFQDYQERMASIFTECRRVLKPDGVMTLMFTHKATGAWDALATGLMDASFSISASWPINTESESSLHIRDKSAAKSTIFLVCRPRPVGVKNTEADRYWEDVEPLVARAVRKRVSEFQTAGIGGVDLYLASFGPALEEFSRHWPLKRGTPVEQPKALRNRKQQELFEETWDPYAVSPEDALNAARREVKRWRLEQLTHAKTKVELDPLTSWFVLAWDAFRAPVFPYDEALRLARAVGVDLDLEVIGRVAEKKGSDVRIWDSGTRAAKHALGPADGSRAMLDSVHHAAHFARTRTLDAARELLVNAGVSNDPQFFATLEAILEVLPVGKAFSQVELDGDLGASGSDFDVLENLRRLAFSAQVDSPKQLEMWVEAAGA
ncbi:MAG: DUF1156 domain-containing protein [Gemmatimonadaceae bacterium]|nr:DUF1156 domain-containing protein [Gemmatimonadaceae bacterium]